MSVSRALAIVVVAYAGFLILRRAYRLLIGNRSAMWRTMVTIAGFGLGWAPARRGSGFGYLALLVGVAALLSLAAPRWATRTRSARVRRGRRRPARVDLDKPAPFRTPTPRFLPPTGPPRLRLVTDARPRDHVATRRARTE